MDIISGVGGRLIATFNMPDGSKMSGTIGSTLSGDLTITELSVKNVVVTTKGNGRQIAKWCSTCPWFTRVKRRTQWRDFIRFNVNFKS